MAAFRCTTFNLNNPKQSQIYIICHHQGRIRQYKLVEVSNFEATTVSQRVSLLTCVANLQHIVEKRAEWVHQLAYTSWREVSSRNALNAGSSSPWEAENIPCLRGGWCFWRVNTSSVDHFIVGETSKTLTVDIIGLSCFDFADTWVKLITWNTAVACSCSQIVGKTFFGYLDAFVIV